MYASKVDRFEEPRSGGRAGHRYGDHVRRRWWGRGLSHQPAQGEAAPRGPDISEVSDSMLTALRAALGQRSFSQIPLDPIAAVRRSQRDTAKYNELCQRLPLWDDADIIGELCVAALYMRAAYGYAARAGMIDSVRAGAMTFSLQKVVFNVADDVDDFSNSQAFTNMMGLCSADVARASWKTRGPFQAAHVVARDHEMQWIVVAIRGTLSFQDILTDAAAQSVRFLDGFVHEGVAKTAQFVADSLHDLLAHEMQAWPGYRLVLCGHSLGGAVATIVAAKLREQAAWAKTCIAYGIGTPGGKAHRAPSERRVGKN